VKAAVIGYGVMGRKHVSVLSSMKGINFVGVVDPLVSSAPPHPLYQSVAQLLEKTKVDFAVVATSTSSHAAVATTLMIHGVHTLIEKPLTSTTEEARELDRLSTQQHLHAAVGFTERFNPTIQCLREHLSAADVHSLEAHRLSPYPSRISDVGVRLDLAVHDIDLARYLTNSSVEDFSVVESRTKEHEDHSVFLLETDSECPITITSSWLAPFRSRVLKINAGEARYEADLYNRVVKRYTYINNGRYAVEQLYVPFRDPLREQLTAFKNYVETGDRGELATLQDGLRALQIALGEKE